MRPVIIGLVLGVVASGWMVQAARHHTLADGLPAPSMTAGLGLAVIAIGWVIANAAPRFTSALAAAAAPGAMYGALMLAKDGDNQLAYGWSAVPVALACLAAGAGAHASRHGQKAWSARRGTAPKLPRVRTR